MKLFRNAEFAKAFALLAALSIAASAAAFYWELRFGVFVLLLCAVFLLIFCLTSYRRYKRISSFAADINKLLHGELSFPIDAYAEGELAVLQSEVYKMTIRMREQQQGLIDDRVYLADSLADISHQIRTPLTSINLLVNFLSEPNITDERRLKLTRELYSLLSRIDWLITALLKISRLDTGTVQFKTESLPLQELLEKAVDPILIPIELREQSLSISASGSFLGDPSWTAEAITNIVKNCMEHTPDGGELAITAAENPLYSEIIITDTGSGISPKDLPHIFERFYKGSSSEKTSFGIGLALARTIITAQNGTIKAENRHPLGAKFTIRFYKGAV